MPVELLDFTDDTEMQADSACLLVILTLVILFHLLAFSVYLSLSSLLIFHILFGVIFH